MSKASNSNSAKRRQSHKKKLFSDAEYPKVTSNMVGLSTTSSNSKGKQLALSFAESDTERSSNLKEILIEPEETYQHTRIRIEAFSPIDYNSLAKRIKTDDEDPAIVRSHSSKSDREIEAFTYMAYIPEEMPGNLRSKHECNRRSTRCFKINKSLSMISIRR